METKDNQYEKRPDLRESLSKKLALKIKKPKTKEKEKLSGKELGQIQELHLFEPPIDPALLVKARAMELNKKVEKEKVAKEKIMSNYADKTQENKSQSVANNPYQMESSSESAFQFVDNRPETIIQRKIQKMANDQFNKPIQKHEIDGDEELLEEELEPIQRKENNTGLPDNLKSGIENLSGYSMDDVKVHRNSDKPAHLQAHAYAQGTDIHLAPGQEKHLPHEAWHVAQQKQGRVKPTIQMKGKVNVNDDAGLEKEADEMGLKATQYLLPPINKVTQLRLIPSVTINSNSAIFQLYDDINKRYENAEIEGKEGWLQRFTQAQKILNDQKHVEHALKNLTDWMVQKNRTLPQALSDFEADVWGGEKLILTDFVPEGTFLDMLQQGKIFEDLVGESHGVHSHRIQWFMLQMKLGAQETLELYKEAGNPRWKNGGKYMWDRIVDGLSGEGDTDFTVPDYLETYINNKYGYFKSWLDKNRLPKELHEVHELQPELKANIRNRFPKEAEYTPVLEHNVEVHKFLTAKIKENNSKELTLQKFALNKLIEKEKVKNTTTLNNETKTIEWTGWIFTESSQLKDAPTYLTPTVGKIMEA